MARYIGQLSDSFLPYSDITRRINSGKFDKIVKIGIQVDNTCFVRIDGVDYEVGPIDRIEYDDVAIQTIAFRHKGGGSGLISAIVDYIYEIKE